METFKFNGMEAEYDFDGDVHTWTNPLDGRQWTMEKPKSEKYEVWKNQRFIDMMWTMMEPGDERNRLMDKLQLEKYEKGLK